MIVQSHMPHPTHQCCPECGGAAWTPRKVSSGRTVYDCAECQNIVRVDDSLCPTEDAIQQMAADLRAHRGMTWSEEE